MNSQTIFTNEQGQAVEHGLAEYSLPTHGAMPSHVHAFTVGELRGVISVWSTDDGQPERVAVECPSGNDVVQDLLADMSKLFSLALRSINGGLDTFDLMNVFGTHGVPYRYDTGNPSRPKASSVMQYVSIWLQSEFGGIGYVNRDGQWKNAFIGKSSVHWRDV